MRTLYPLAWTEIDIGIQEIADTIKKSELNFNYIYGIPRGGLPLAVMLSHLLNKPLIMNLDARHKILLVDDICDSGDTIDTFLKLSKNIVKVVCLINLTKRTDIISCRLGYGEDENFTFDKKWVIFPWESRENAKNDLKKYESRTADTNK